MTRIIILLLLLSTALSAQKVDIKKVSIQTIDGTDYYVSADTSSGEITIHLVPVQDQVKMLAAQIAQIDAEIARYDELLDQIDQQRRDARTRKKEIEKLQGNLQAKQEKTTPIPDIPKKDAPAPVKPATINSAKKKKGGGR